MKLVKTIPVLIIGINDYLLTSRKQLINEDKTKNKLYKCTIETYGDKILYRKRKALCREIQDDGGINNSPIIADVPNNSKLYNEDLVDTHAKINQYLIDEEKNRYYYELIL
jgi:hypothetical protein